MSKGSPLGAHRERREISGCGSGCALARLTAYAAVGTMVRHLLGERRIAPARCREFRWHITPLGLEMPNCRPISRIVGE